MQNEFGTIVFWIKILCTRIEYQRSLDLHRICVCGHFDTPRWAPTWNPIYIPGTLSFKVYD